MVVNHYPAGAEIAHENPLPAGWQLVVKVAGLPNQGDQTALPYENSIHITSYQFVDYWLEVMLFDINILLRLSIF